MMNPLKPLLGLSTNSGRIKKTPDHKVAVRINKKKESIFFQAGFIITLLTFRLKTAGIY